MLDTRSNGAQVQDRDPHPREPAAEGLVKADSLDTSALCVWHLPASLEKIRSLFNRRFLAAPGRHRHGWNSELTRKTVRFLKNTVELVQS